jgi:hypothetical protein
VRTSAAAGAAAAADRHDDHLHVRQFLEDLQRVGADSGDEQRFVRGVDVTQPAFVLQRFDFFARFVEVAPVLDHFGSIGPHRGVLLGIVPERHDDCARHTFALAGERNRLSVIPGRRGDYAVALGRRQTADQIETAAHLERARRVVVLMFDEHIEPGLAREQRVAHQRRRADGAIHPLAGVIDVGQRWYRHHRLHRILVYLWRPPSGGPAPSGCRLRRCAASACQ